MATLAESNACGGGEKYKGLDKDVVAACISK